MNIESSFQANYLKRALCKRSLFTHAKVGMGYHYIPDDAQDWCQWLQSKWNPCAPERNNVMVQVMRDSFKSTTITQSYPSWLLAHNPNLAILILSKKDSNAKMFADAQRKRFETGDFQEIFGKWRTRNKWDSEKMFIKGRKIPRKEPSIMSAGIKSSLTSLHFDVIIMDDITTNEDMYSAAEREAGHRMYREAFDIIDKRHGLILLVGTCWHNDDVLERVKKQQKQKEIAGADKFHIYFRPAKNKEDSPEYNFSWLTDKYLNQIREDKADIRDFAANYLLKPIPDSAKIFVLEKFTYYDYYRDIDREAGKDRSVKMMVQFTDPSLKETEKNCYSAIVTIGVIEGILYVLDADIEQRPPSRTISAIADRYENLKAEFNCGDFHTFMETVMFQEFMRDQAVNKYCAEGRYIPLNPFDQKENKVARITSMERHISAGIVRFRKDWEQIPGYRLLMEHLDNFPLGFIDGADALQGAVSLAMQMNESQVSFIG